MKGTGERRWGGPLLPPIKVILLRIHRGDHFYLKADRRTKTGIQGLWQLAAAITTISSGKVWTYIGVRRVVTFYFLFNPFSPKTISFLFLTLLLPCDRLTERTNEEVLM